MIGYRVEYIGGTDHNHYIVTFNESDFFGSREYAVYYVFSNGHINVDEVDVVERNCFTRILPSVFVKTHQDDIDFLTYFMNKWYTDVTNDVLVS